jgi:hypothetical protein
MEFLDWLLTQKKETGPIGDLARDANRDLKYGEWKPLDKTPESLHGRMWISNACEDAHRAFEAAVTTWKEQ